MDELERTLERTREDEQRAAEIERQQEEAKRQTAAELVAELHWSEEYKFLFSQEEARLVPFDQEERTDHLEVIGPITVEAVALAKEGRAGEVTAIDAIGCFMTEEQAAEVRAALVFEDTRDRAAELVAAGAAPPQTEDFRVVGCVLSAGEKALDTVASVAEAILDLFDPPKPRQITPQELWASKEAEREYVAQLEAETRETEALDRIAGQIQKDKLISYADLLHLGRDSLEQLKERGDDGLRDMVRQRQDEQERER
jgi:hypothetical protein